jgi:hypothetical protein
MDINDIIEIVKYGYLKKEIGHLRGLDEDKYGKEKLNLPAVTLSGIFNKRNSLNIKSHSGLIQIDIDDVDDYKEAFYNICNNEYTYVCFKSPGGKGIKVIVKILPSPETHQQQFYALQRYFKEELNIVIDPLCKDVSRCMLLSYDPHLYCNPFSPQFKEKLTPPVIPHTFVEENKVEYQTNLKRQTVDIEKLIAEIQAKKIDITPSYTEWIRVGFALCTTFGENGRKYFHLISEHYPKYSFEENEKTYTNLLKRNNGTTKFGSLLFIANAHGISTKK